MRSRMTLSQHHYALCCAPSHLKKDEEVVLAGVRRDPNVLGAADTSLRTNRGLRAAVCEAAGTRLEVHGMCLAARRSLFAIRLLVA